MGSLGLVPDEEFLLGLVKLDGIAFLARASSVVGDDLLPGVASGTGKVELPCDKPRSLILKLLLGFCSIESVLAMVLKRIKPINNEYFMACTPFFMRLNVYDLYK